MADPALPPFSVRQALAQDRPRPCDVARPKQLTCWSKLSEQEGGKFLYGSTQGLGRYKAPTLPVDLNQGYPDKYHPKDINKGSPVETVIEAVLHAEGEHGPLLQGAHVVTYRNNLNKIFGTALSPKDSWEVGACLHNGILFLEIITNRDDGFPDKDIMTYYGYKFEVVCTETQDGSDPCEAPVDPTAEFATLVCLRADGLNILVAAEVDLVDSNQPVSPDKLPPLGSYLELKTVKQPQHPGQRRTLVNFKWPKWWLQSFIAGVETIVMGTRDEAGNVIQIERLPVQHLPGMARREGARWDAWQAMRLGTDMLRWMHQCARAQPDTHLVFSYAPGPNGAPGEVHCRVNKEGRLPERLAGLLG